VVKRVQDIMRDFIFSEQLGKQLRLFNGNGADEYGLTFFVTFLDLVDDSVTLSGFILVDNIVEVRANHRLIRRDFHDIELVN
jgi:hypothetical protein